MLQEGISHIEDLSVDDFIRVVSDLGKFRATEKLDGANLWVGVDSKGRIFTSREGKSSKADRFFNEEDYPYFAANNGFRSTLAAFKQVESDVKTALQPGDTVEVEVLYGRQPNAVTYGAGGKNFIAILRGVEGTSNEKADALVRALANRTATVKVKVVDTADGINLTVTDQDITYQFVGAQQIPAEKLSKVNVTKQLDDLKDFLNSPAEGVDGLTNAELMAKSMSSVPQEQRAKAKEQRELVRSKVMRDFKLPIKQELLDQFVRQLKSPLSDDSDDGVGIEGVVLQEPSTGEQVKLVDKEEFTTLNKFNHAVRGGINGVVRTTDPAAPKEARGGTIGNMKIMIADFLGNRDLARSATAKRIITGLKKESPAKTAHALADELIDTKDHISVKKKLMAIVQHAIDTLKADLEEFEKNKDHFKIHLKNGKEQGLSPEVVRRTRLAFAEALRDTAELHKKLDAVSSPAALVAVLYGRLIKAVHAGGSEELSEALLLEKRQFTDKTQYARKDSWTLMNIYFASVMMAAVILQAQDKIGIRFLRDKAHMRLKKWGADMSMVNFWGYPIWRAGQPNMKKLIGRRTAAEIHKAAKRAPANNWRYIHIDIAFAGELPIEWKEHRKTLQFLQRLPGMNVDRVNTLLDGCFNYANLSLDEKIKLHNKLHLYVMQFIPHNELNTRIRAIYHDLLLNANGENYQMVENMKLIKQVIGEDADATATSAAAVAPVELPVGLNKGQRHTVLRRTGTEWINRIKDVKLRKQTQFAVAERMKGKGQ